MWRRAAGRPGTPWRTQGSGSNVPRGWDLAVREGDHRDAPLLPAKGGYFFAPTVLGEVPSDARILREEVFGPVAPVSTFSTEEQAIEAANATEYGLVAYIYTRDLARTLRVSEAIEAGMVGVTRASSPTRPPPSGA